MFKSWLETYAHFFSVGIEYFATRHEINTATNMLATMMQMAAKPMEKRKIVTKTWKSSGWFDDECKLLKSRMTKALRKFRCKRDDDSLNLFLSAKKTYKQATQSKKKNAKTDKENLFAELFEAKDSKQLWSNLKSIVKAPSETNSNISSVSIHAWIEHLKNILNSQQKP